jgi:hypothetical protein
MRKHRLFGVVIATLLGTGLLIQRPSAPRVIHDPHLVLDTTPAGTTATTDQVQAQAFTVKAVDAAARDTMIALTSDVKPLPPITAPPPPPTPPTAPSADVWAELRQCESNDNYADNTGNGYYGAYQFSEATWQSLGYSGLPSEASPATQDAAAQRLQARSGWGQWPTCSRRLGLT